MDMEGASGRAAVTLKRSEIDTAAPFRSVREAVTMFGHTQLVGAQPYASYKLNHAQMGLNGKSPSDGNENPWDLDVEAELAETKYSLQKAREESLVMENRMSSLRQELETTKRELQLLKSQNGPQPPKQLENGNGDDEDDQLDEIESVEIVEDSAKQLERRNMQIISSDDDKEEDQEAGNDKHVNDDTLKISTKRYVNAAAATILAQEMFVPQGRALERHPSLRRKKKKGLIPLIGAFFSKTKTTAAHEVA